MPALINLETITAYDYAIDGSWGNPLAGTPWIDCQVAKVRDYVDSKGRPSSELLRVVGRIHIPYQPEAVIDPAAVGIDGLPPITHQAFYGYFKSMLLAAMQARVQPAATIQEPAS